MRTRRFCRKRVLLGLEELEQRLVPTGPTNLSIPLDPNYDQFGDQVLTVQAYGDYTVNSFGIFDTGAACLSFSAADQDKFSRPIPTRLPAGGASAEGIGGPIIGDVSEANIVLADGLHAVTLQYLPEGYSVFTINLSSSAAIPSGVQAFVGTEAGSPNLLTLTGAPILNPSAHQPQGLAALINVQALTFDLTNLQSGLYLTLSDLNFVSPGTSLAAAPGTTNPVRIPLTTFGGDNHLHPGTAVTKSPLPLQPEVTLSNGNLSVNHQHFLLDTGAQMSVISTAEAQALGLDLAHPTLTTKVEGSGGEVLDVPGFTIDDLCLPLSDGGTLHFTSVPVFVYDIAGNIDGLLGMNLFNTAASMLYDPFGPGGASVQLTFYTQPDRSRGFLTPSQQESLIDKGFAFFVQAAEGRALPGYLLPAPTQLTVTATPIGVTTGAAFDGGVASFTSSDPYSVEGDFTATITWGDGSTSSGQIETNELGGFNVLAQHTYTQAGTFPLTVTVHGPGHSSASDNGTAQVTGWSATAVTLWTTPGTPFAGRVASFSNPDPSFVKDDFTASIVWGDGTTTAGTITANSQGGFHVTGQHTYTVTGTYSLEVTITGPQGISTSATAWAHVLGLTATPVNIQTTPGHAFNELVGTFTCTDSGVAPDNFAAGIDWGDGTITNGTITANNQGGFDVAGQHTYSTAGTYSFTVTINGPGGSSATATGTAQVTNLTLSVTAGTFETTPGAGFGGLVGSFICSDPLLGKDDFTANIIWGDGNSSSGTISANSQGGFHVTGQHTYTTAGTYSFRLRITGPGGSSATATGSAKVIALSATTVAIRTTPETLWEGSVGAFTCTDSNAVKDNFSATITWGDGTTSAGIIASNSLGGFDVSGQHTYARAGTYSLILSVTGPGGSTASATGQVTVQGFSDDFNRPDQFVLGRGWMTAGGEWAIHSNQLLAAGDTLNLAISTGTQLIDESVQASFALGTSGFQYAGLVLRYVSPGTLYLGQIVAANGAFTAGIFRAQNNTWTLLASSPLSTGPGILRFQIVGNFLTLSLNGTLVASALDSALPEPGLAGLWASKGVSLDNFLVGAQPVALPFADSFDGANGSALAPVWRSDQGQFQSQANRAQGMGPVNLAVYGEGSAADVSVQADIELPSSGVKFAGLVARYTGPGSFYLGEVVANAGSNTAYLFRASGGAWSLLASAPVASGTGTLRFQVVGNSLELLLGSTLLLSAQNSALPGPGLTGLWASQGGTLDNFQAALQFPALPFTDSFEGANGSALAPVWGTDQGQFQCQTNRAQGMGPVNLAVYGKGSAADVSVQADIELPSSGVKFAGLVVRYTGPGSFYLGEVVGNAGSYTAYLFRASGGAWSLLASARVTNGTGNLRLEAVGSYLQLLLNDAVIAYASDYSHGSPGLVGLWASQSATLDNLRAESRGTETQDLPFSDSFTRPDGASPSNAWSIGAGHFTVQSGQLRAMDPAFNLALLNQVPAADVAVQAQIGLASTGLQFAGLVVRANDSGDQYLGEIVSLNGSYAVYLFRILGGTQTLLAYASASSGSGTLRLEAVGSSLKLFLDGRLLTAASDSSLGCGTTGFFASAGTLLDNFAAETIALATPALPFTDSFTQADNTALNRSWSENLGNFAVQSQRLLGRDANGNLATVNQGPVADVAIQGHMALPANGVQYAGLVARHSGTGLGNMYLGEVVSVNGTSKAYLFRCLGGTWTLLSSAAVGGSTGLLRFEAVGNSLKLFLNGQLVAYAFDASLAGGTTGVWAGSGTTLDDVAVSPISLNSVTPPFTDNFTQAGGSQLSRSWTERAGHFSINAQQQLQADNSALSLATVNQAATANLSVQANLILKDNTLGQTALEYGGLVARLVDGNNMYVAEFVSYFDGSKYSYAGYIFLVKGGAWSLLKYGTVVDPNSVKRDGSDLMKFDTNGGSLTLSLNGQQLVSANDTTLGSGVSGCWGGPGFGLDNFSIQTI